MANEFELFELFMKSSPKSNLDKMRSHTKAKSYPTAKLDSRAKLSSEIQIGLTLRQPSFYQLCGSMISKNGEPFTSNTEEELDNPVVVRDDVLSSDSSQSFPFPNQYSSSSGCDFILWTSNSQVKPVIDKKSETSNFILDEFDPQAQILRWLQKNNESRLISIGYTYPSSITKEVNLRNNIENLSFEPRTQIKQNKTRPRSLSSNIPLSIESNVRII